MVTDAEARKAVRALMERFDLVTDQFAGLAYVLARKDLQRYARLLGSAERATTLVIQPVREVDGGSKEIYAALDDPEADWCKAICTMLDNAPVILESDQGIERFRLLEELGEKFDAEDKKGDEEER